VSQEYEIDFDRKKRLGFPEVIYGASKTEAVLDKILQSYKNAGQNALITKLQPEKAGSLQEHYPKSEYDPLSGAFLLETPSADPQTTRQTAILSAGASDAYVVNEAYHTLRYLGCPAKRINDIGIAGIHRLLDKLEALRSFDLLIVVAGFEGALPTAVGGLLPQPIIAVPASVGYGVSAGGQAALNTMLGSCANGIAVVNIDNGYGAAMAAYRILKAMTQSP